MRGWRAGLGIAGGICLVIAAAMFTYGMIMRSPEALEELSGIDSDIQHVIPAARRGDRLKNDRLDAVARAQSETDFDTLLRLGHPSVDAVWSRRVRLPAPRELAGTPMPTSTDAVPLAYASTQATDQPQRDPFRVIDEAQGRTRNDQVAAVPLPLPRPKIEEEDDSDDEDPVPLPLPRPRNLVAPQTASVVATLPSAPDPAHAPVSLMPAAPPQVAVTRSLHPVPDTPAPAPQPGFQLASLPSSTQQDAPRTGPTLMTPFGVPYTLQIDSVQTSCFPPALVELLRRIEQQYHQRPIVTSGYRDHGRSGSLHRRCMAADIMVPGVSAAQLAKDARKIPGMGGVGQYCHPNLVHVDIGTPRDWKYGCGSYFSMRDGSTSWGRTPQAD